MRWLSTTETIETNSRIGQCGIFIVLSVVLIRRHAGRSRSCSVETPPPFSREQGVVVTFIGRSEPGTMPPTSGRLLPSDGHPRSNSKGNVADKPGVIAWVASLPRKVV
jgi:hypothetical protein